MNVKVSELLGMAKWTQRSQFPNTERVDDKIWSFGGGIYLLTKSAKESNCPAYAIGWAVSDYWAKRIWARTFSPDFDEEIQKKSPPPEFLDSSIDPTYSAILGYEASRRGKRKSILISAGYRHPDGLFVSHSVFGDDQTTYHFGNPNPGDNDAPIAIERKLKEEG